MVVMLQGANLIKKTSILNEGRQIGRQIDKQMDIQGGHQITKTKFPDFFMTFPDFHQNPMVNNSPMVNRVKLNA